MNEADKDLLAASWAEMCRVAMGFSNGHYVTIRKEKGEWFVACQDSYGFVTAEGKDLIEVLLVAGFVGDI